MSWRIAWQMPVVSTVSPATVEQIVVDDTREYRFEDLPENAWITNGHLDHDETYYQRLGGGRGPLFVPKNQVSFTAPAPIRVSFSVPVEWHTAELLPYRKPTRPLAKYPTGMLARRSWWKRLLGWAP